MVPGLGSDPYRVPCGLAQHFDSLQYPSKDLGRRSVSPLPKYVETVIDGPSVGQNIGRNRFPPGIGCAAPPLDQFQFHLK